MGEDGMGPVCKTLSTVRCERCTVPVRKRCDSAVKAPEHYIRGFSSSRHSSKERRRIFCPTSLKLRRGAVVSKFLNRNRNISTSQLNALLRLHLKPINLVIS